MAFMRTPSFPLPLRRRLPLRLPLLLLVLPLPSPATHPAPLPTKTLDAPTAPPMTYRHEGKQFIVFAFGGRGNEKGLIAFSLP